MNVKLYIKENNFIKLSLFSGKKETDCLKWQDKNSLSRALLANLDKLLTKNGLGLDHRTSSSNEHKKHKDKSTKIGEGVDKISGYTIMSKVPRKWTTYRIAEITLKTLNIARLR